MSQAGKELAEILRPTTSTSSRRSRPWASPRRRSDAPPGSRSVRRSCTRRPRSTWPTPSARPVRSITTDAEQRLLFDRARVSRTSRQARRHRRRRDLDRCLDGRARCACLRGVGAEVVAIGTLVTEADSGAARWATTRRWCAPSARYPSFDPMVRVASSRTGTARTTKGPGRYGPGTCASIETR
jgi:hypothetical protein